MRVDWCVSSWFRIKNTHSLQGSHLNLSQTSAQRQRTYFLVNNKAVNLAQARVLLTLLLPGCGNSRHKEGVAKEFPDKQKENRTYN